MTLNDELRERYSRNIILPEVGDDGQQKLIEARVLIVGVGGLGSSSSLYLAAAGLGTIGIVDSDLVDLSNLQRQILHETLDIGRLKVDSAKEKLMAINPDLNVCIHAEQLTAENALDIIKGYDFVIDATDNFSSKFLIADACHFAGKPYSHAGILCFEGQTMTVIPEKTTCYRCIFDGSPSPESVSSAVRKGVMGVLPGVIGTMQATEAIKYFLGVGELLTDRIATYDGLKMKYRNVALERNENCPLCGNNRTIIEIFIEE